MFFRGISLDPIPPKASRHDPWGPPCRGATKDFEVAGKESVAAYESGQLRAFIRHARIADDRAGKFWEEIERVIHAFDRLPRSRDTAYGFAVGLYPILGYPTLPPADDD